MCRSSSILSTNSGCLQFIIQLLLTLLLQLKITRLLSQRPAFKKFFSLVIQQKILLYIILICSEDVSREWDIVGVSMLRNYARQIYLHNVDSSCTCLLYAYLHAKAVLMASGNHSNLQWLLLRSTSRTTSNNISFRQ